MFRHRWKGENVATSEVGDVLTMAQCISEANVYGVKVEGILPDLRHRSRTYAALCAFGMLIILSRLIRARRADWHGSRRFERRRRVGLSGHLQARRQLPPFLRKTSIHQDPGKKKKKRRFDVTVSLWL